MCISTGYVRTDVRTDVRTELSDLQTCATCVGRDGQCTLDRNRQNAGVGGGDIGGGLEGDSNSKDGGDSEIGE